MSDERKDGQGQNQKPSPGPQLRVSTNYEFVIEIGDSKNRNLLCPLTQKVMRGRWNRDNLQDMSVDHDSQFASMRRMPTLPGIRIHVNTAKKMVRVFDPLGEPEYEQTLQVALSVMESAFKKKCAPQKEQIFDQLSDDEVKSWLYWSRRYLDGQQANLESGRVPEMRDVLALPGKVIKSSNQEAMTDEERYRPVAV